MLKRDPKRGAVTTEPPQEPGPDGEWTCGKGLAAHARIPAGIAELLACLAQNLEAHVPTIDVAYDAGRAERDAYVGLSTEVAELAKGLARTAERMRECEDLPAAGHHEKALGDPRLIEVFERLLTLQKEFADLLLASAEEDERLLSGSEGKDEDAGGRHALGPAAPILRVSDVPSSIAYYVEKLGFDHDWGDSGLASVSRERCTIFLCEWDQGRRGTWAWVGAGDAGALHEELVARGAKIRFPPTNYSWAYEMQVEDLDGNVLRFGSDPKDGEPYGEFLDAAGVRWPMDESG